VFFVGILHSCRLPVSTYTPAPSVPRFLSIATVSLPFSRQGGIITLSVARRSGDGAARSGRPTRVDCAVAGPGLVTRGIWTRCSSRSTKCGPLSRSHCGPATIRSPSLVVFGTRWRVERPHDVEQLNPVGHSQAGTRVPTRAGVVGAVVATRDVSEDPLSGKLLI
jgi:hypothetical protein